MIRQSYLATSVLFTLSIFAHGAALSITEQSETAAVAGGAATSVAQLGNNFQDMVVGVMEAIPTSETPADMPEKMDAAAETVEVETPVEPITSAAQSPTSTSQQTTLATQQPAKFDNTPQTEMPVVTSVSTQAEPILNDAPPIETIQQTVPTIAALPPQEISSLAMVTTAQITPHTPLEVTAPAQKTVSTALPQQDPSPRVSRRPTVRPKALEEKIAKTKRSPSKFPQPKKTVKSQPKGNAKTQARAGVADGKTTASATVAGKLKSTRSNQAGNAAISNYPGLVFRKISRQKRPKTATKAIAVVSFTIAANGSISSIGISNASGSPKLDEAAIALVKRAAPFPKPPNGAKTRYKVQVKGR